MPNSSTRHMGKSIKSFRGTEHTEDLPAVLPLPTLIPKLSCGSIHYFYSVLGDHAIDCKSSTHSLRYQGSEVSTDETFSRKYKSLRIA